MEFLDEIKAAEEQAARQKQEALSQAKTIRQQARQESRRQVQALKEETNSKSKPSAGRPRSREKHCPTPPARSRSRPAGCWSSWLKAGWMPG